MNKYKWFNIIYLIKLILTHISYFIFLIYLKKSILIINFILIIINITIISTNYNKIQKFYFLLYIFNFYLKNKSKISFYQFIN